MRDHFIRVSLHDKAGKENYPMLRKNKSISDTWELQSSLGKHRAFAQWFRFAFAAAVVLLVACLDSAPSVFAQSSASDWVNSGIAKSKNGNLDGAIADYSRAIELDPKYAIAYFNRGNAKSNKGELEGAIADYSRAIDIDPKYAKAYNNRGNAKNKKGDLGGAIADYSRAIEIDPKSSKPYNNRGIAKQDMGDLDGSVADYSRAIELDPKYAIAYFNRGVVFMTKGRFDQAIADYTSKIELTPNDENASLHLVIALWLAKGDAEEATERLRKRILADGSNEWVRTISKYYLGIDNLNEQAVLREARQGKDGKRVGEKLCEAYYYLGIKSLFAGNRKDAVEYFTLSIGTNAQSIVEYHAAKSMLALMNEEKI